MSKTVPYRDVERVLITRLEDIPDFGSMSREEEAEWWERHDVATDLMETGPDVYEEVYLVLGLEHPKRPKK